MNDGRIVFEVTADGKKAVADIKDITKSIEKETKQWDAAAGEATSGMEQKFGALLKKLAAGFGAAKIGKALLDFGQDAIRAASDLQEVQNVVDTTFGSSANVINEWAQNAGAQFGLTETQAKKFASTMGAMMKSSGLAGDEIVGMSTDLAGLAADMASFYNLDFEEAFQKIRSGISGETEPLKQLGINMSVANLEAFALQQGLDKTFSQMSQGEQTMLRYQYMMQATADAQGDFSRTSDGYANTVRNFQTQIENLKTNVGDLLIPAVTDVIGFINKMMTALQPDTKKRTVLDDFRDIDLKTAEKIAGIDETAEKARGLAETLATIDASTGTIDTSGIVALVDSTGKLNTQKADTVKGLLSAAKAANGVSIDLDSFLTGLNGVGVTNATAVKSLIETLSQDKDALAELTGKNAEEAAAWLSSIADAANKLGPENADGWKTLLDELIAGLPNLTTEGGTGVLETLAAAAGLTGDEVAALGEDSEEIARKQRLWLETCKRLVEVIPGLNSIINTETGEVKGGIQAVQDYVDAWEKGQKKIVLLQAVEQRKQALATKFSELPGLELDVMVAQRRLKQAYATLRDTAKQYGAQLGFDASGKISRDWNVFGLDDAGRKALNDAADAYEKLRGEYDANAAKFKEQQAAYDEAVAAQQEYVDAIEEGYGSLETALAEATKEMNTLEKAASGDADALTEVSNAVKTAQDAFTALADHVQEVHEAALSAVNDVASGLNRVDYNAFGKQIEKISELTQKQAQYKVGSDEWKKLNDEISKANASLVSTDNIYKNLESQEQFLDEYLANLAKAREMGLSNALLSELSDGSVESAQYLSALVNDSTGKTAAEIDRKYQEIQGKKDALAKDLAEQQLTVDKTYQGLAEKAKEAISALDLGEEAKASAAATIQGIADGIGEKSDEVSTAVSGIISELERLNGFGISIDFGGFGKISFTTSTGKNADTSGRYGVDFVPRDDYLIRAHEGERLLTAQENQIWNTLRNGGVAGFDLETLGGVMRDNVKAGGNVYLDGRIVGSVISDQQGKSYRQLQRSGWQR